MLHYIVKEGDVMEKDMQFSLPRYEEIPDIGLYLDQTAKYINSYLEPLGDMNITPSMISNYVKHGLVENPVKKQYGQEQIAYLFLIAIAKSVMSLENIQVLINMQRERYASAIAYNYFRDELLTILAEVFEVPNVTDAPSPEASLEQKLCRNMVVAIAHKIYLDRSIRNFAAKEDS